jgi:hypothetical protein
MIPTPMRRGGGGSTQEIDAVCAAGDAIGDVVYISADKVGSLYSVAKVDIDNAAPWRGIGIGVVKSKPTATTCRVQLGGLLQGVYSGLTPGRRLFVNTSSQLSPAPPAPPVSGRRLSQRIAYAVSADTILIDPKEPIALQQ